MDRSLQISHLQVWVRSRSEIELLRLKDILALLGAIEDHELVGRALTVAQTRNSVEFGDFAEMLSDVVCDKLGPEGARILARMEEHLRGRTVQLEVFQYLRLSYEKRDILELTSMAPDELNCFVRELRELFEKECQA